MFLNWVRRLWIRLSILQTNKFQNERFWYTGQKNDSLFNIMYICLKCNCIHTQIYIKLILLYFLVPKCNQQHSCISSYMIWLAVRNTTVLMNQESSFLYSKQITFKMNSSGQKTNQLQNIMWTHNGTTIEPFSDARRQQQSRWTCRCLEHYYVLNTSIFPIYQDVRLSLVSVDGTWFWWSAVPQIWPRQKMASCFSNLKCCYRTYLAFNQFYISRYI